MAYLSDFLCQADVDLYNTKRLPEWAHRTLTEVRAMRWGETLGELIDRAVNAHARVWLTSGEASALNLLSSVRGKNSSELQTYLENIGSNFNNPSDTHYSRRKASFARKWARKLSEQQA